MNVRDSLPTEYIENMSKVPGIELDAFLAIYDKPAVKALRFNTKKVRPETIEKLIREWNLEPVPWCRDAYYYEETQESGLALSRTNAAQDEQQNEASLSSDESDKASSEKLTDADNLKDIRNDKSLGKEASRSLRPGLSPYHDAGVFYIQEPSAMITAEKADIKPEDIVLDLCAAPGGKSTQAAAKSKYLISNEPIPNRARTLSSNIERMGFDNCIVSSAYPDELAKVFTDYFDKIIVDAPCSGEGMMRKDETARTEWSPANVAQCIVRQGEILESASTMLKPGGRLIYSTCTFEPGENEGQIKAFLKTHPDYSLISSETLYPHQIKGEGHYCAVLERASGNPTYTAENLVDGTAVIEDVSEAVSSNSNIEEIFNETFFAKATDVKVKKKLKETISSNERKKGKNGGRLKIDRNSTLSEISEYMRKNKLHILRTGVEPGETITDKKGNKRYEPSHAEALSGYFGSAEADSVNLLEESDAISYLKGNIIDLDKLLDRKSVV